MATTVDFPIPLTDGGTLRGALALPDGEIGGPRPGVVVLHEAFGLNDDIRRIAGRFADNGYAALAPDLYSHGRRALCLTRILVETFATGPKSTTLADIEATRAALAAHPAVDEQRLAIIGFCQGGGFALAFAAGHGRSLRAASVNYGRVPKRQAALADVCPVVASYGDLDRVFKKDAQRLEQYLAALGVPHDVTVYDGVGHSFMNQSEPPAWMARLPNPMTVGYGEPQAEDSWRRILAFFDEHVRR